MPLYTVWGDYGYTNETAILETTDFERAIDVARDYSRELDGDFDVIEVATHGESGEYIVFWREDVRDEFEIY